MHRIEPPHVLTIGHSSHSYERFAALLREAGITAVADVRTSPYSQNFPQFNRETLKEKLRQDGVAYSFLGKALGGRPKGREFYCEGVADYEKMARTAEFAKDLDRIVEGAKKYRIALMCSEQDPLDCHRCLLVARALDKRGVRIDHILADGRLVAQPDLERRLLEMSGRENEDLFLSPEERLAEAYRRRARKAAFVERTTGPEKPIAAE